MRTLLVIAIALTALVPSGAQASAMDDIQTANQGGQLVFLVVTETGARNIEVARSAAKAAQQRVEGSTVVELNRSDATQADAVRRYKLQATPLPLILVIAPNGVAVGASRPGEGAADRLVSLVPTPKKADMMQAFEQRQTALLVFSRAKMPEQSQLFQNLSAVTREMKDKVRFVLIDLDDEAETKFIEEWKVPMESVRPSILVLNSKGQALGRLVGAPTAKKLIETCKKRAPCCSDPKCKGCGK